MKHCLILSMCAVALTAFSINSANAAIDVALNLRYDDPADPNEGGSWTLVAKTDAAGGLGGLVVRIEDGTIPAAGTIGAGIGHDINGGALQIGTFTDPNGPDFVEFVYGQDPNDGLVGAVGTSGGPGDQGADPLRNSFWDNAAVIATGSFLDSRPAGVLAAGTEIDPNGAIVAASLGTFSIRGDAAESLGIEAAGTGLLAGDINRDGDVTTGDLSVLLGNFNAPPGAQGWDDGDFTDDNDVATGDLSLLLGTFNAAPTNPGPPIGAVPEPSTALLLLTSVAGMGLVRRKK